MNQYCLVIDVKHTHSTGEADSMSMRDS